MVHKLLGEGLEPWIASHNGRTPLHVAPSPSSSYTAKKQTRTWAMRLRVFECAGCAKSHVSDAGSAALRWLRSTAGGRRLR
eukprot:1836742-Rhodomonas_salina.1